MNDVMNPPLPIVPAPLGTYSEVGILREVLVHRPDLSLTRLTPGNCRDLLFDDVLWVKKARQEHDAFVDTMRERGVVVREFGAMLAETMADPVARAWLLDRRIDIGHLGHGTMGEVRAWLDELSAVQLAAYLVGGITRSDLPFTPGGLFGATRAPHDFVLPPLPNQLFTRDSSCWVGKGVFINPMFWSARRPEAINAASVYRFHPRFRDADFVRYLDASDQDYSPISLEGGDVMPLAGGVVLIGMGERSTPQAVTDYARRLFHYGAATDDFMAGDDRYLRVGQVAVDHVQIGSADAAGGDGDAHLARARLPIRQLHILGGLVQRIQHHGVHGVQAGTVMSCGGAMNLTPVCTSSRSGFSRPRIARARMVSSGAPCTMTRKLSALRAVSYSITLFLGMPMPYIAAPSALRPPTTAAVSTPENTMEAR